MGLKISCYCRPQTPYAKVPLTVVFETQLRSKLLCFDLNTNTQNPQRNTGMEGCELTQNGTEGAGCVYSHPVMDV